MLGHACPETPQIYQKVALRMWNQNSDCCLLFFVCLFPQTMVSPAIHTSAIAAMIIFIQYPFYTIYQVSVMSTTLYEVLEKRLPFIEHFMCTTHFYRSSNLCVPITHPRLRTFPYLSLPPLDDVSCLLFSTSPYPLGSILRYQ